MNGKKLFNIAFGAACAAIIICLAVSLTVWFRPIYYFDIDYLDIPERSGYSAEICRLNYDVLIDYNQIGGPDTLEMPDFPMSDTGRIHFEEVKVIFLNMQYIAIAGVIAIIVKALWDRKRGFTAENFFWLRVTVLTAVTAAAAVLAAVIIDWQWAFTMMHTIFFDNDYWIFNAKTDPVINILPDTFFMHCGLAIILLVIVLMAGFELIYRRIRRKQHHTIFTRRG